MTRARVSDDKRQRIAQACNQCQTRKQKCNGKIPCGTCQKRFIDCTYSPRRPSPGTSRPSNTSHSTRKRVQKELQPSIGLIIPQLSLPSLYVDNPHLCTVPPSEQSAQASDRRLNPNHYSAPVELFEPQWAHHNIHAPDVGIPVTANVRMLRDSEERLFYAGSSAAASFLQEVRALVSARVGLCPFTVDANWYSDDDRVSHSPLDLFALPSLPDRKSLFIIADSFLKNFAGVSDVIDREALDEHLANCYSVSKLHPTPALCLVYLVLACGMITSTVTPTQPSAIPGSCNPTEVVSEAELYFESASIILNSQRDCETPELWTVQAFALMCNFALSVARRNAAYTHLGMAVNASFSLGIHRANDFAHLIGPQQVGKMRRLWKSLVVLDAFTCAFLGRPPLISEEDAGFGQTYVPEERCPAAPEDVHDQCLAYTVAVSQSLRQVLKHVYTPEVLSACYIQALLDYSMLLPTSDSSFFTTGFSVNPVAVLHSRLSQMHTIILATRPFFMHWIRLTSGGNFDNLCNVRLATMATNCLTASRQVISLVYKAYQTSSLPNCDPTWIVPLFLATSLIMCNDFMRRYDDAESESLVSNALTVLDACDRKNRLVNKVWYPLVSFKSVVYDRPDVAKDRNQPDPDQNEPFQKFQVEDVPKGLYDSQFLEGQSIHQGEALGIGCCELNAQHPVSEWSTPTGYDTHSRRQSTQSALTRSDSLRNTSISPGLSNGFDVPWVDEMSDGGDGWAQSEDMIEAGQLHLPAPIITLPSNNHEARSEYDERHTG